MKFGCSSFIPGDDDFVYMCGGENGGIRLNRLFVHDISKNSYTELTSASTVGNYGFAANGCAGAVTPNNEKV